MASTFGVIARIDALAPLVLTSQTSSTSPPCAPFALVSKQCDPGGPRRVVSRRRHRWLPEERSRPFSPSTRSEVVAYHETGHAIVAASSEGLRPCLQDHHRSAYLRRPRLYACRSRRTSDFLTTSARRSKNKIAVAVRWPRRRGD